MNPYVMLAVAGLVAAGGLTLGIVSVVKIAAAALRESGAHETAMKYNELRFLSDQARQKSEVERDRESAAKVQARAESERLRAQNEGLQSDLLNAQAELAKARTAGLDDPDPGVRGDAVADVLRAPA